MYVKFIFIFIFIILLLPACVKDDPGDFLGIRADIEVEIDLFTQKMKSCGIDSETISLIDKEYYGGRRITSLENKKSKNCMDNIREMSCEKFAKVKSLSEIEDCLYLENTDGFPTARFYCTRFFASKCRGVRTCTNYQECNDYNGNSQQDCFSTETCPGDIDLVPQCTGIIEELDSDGCHDANYLGVDSDKIEELNCLHLSDEAIIKHPELIERIEQCDESTKKFYGECFEHNGTHYDFFAPEGCDVYKPQQ